jgi:ferritin-like metal-binding protein YciE
MTPREQFIVWLNDAYSMEIAFIPVLQNHADDAREYPEIRERDLQHLEETRRQAEDVKNLIQQLGGTVSTSKVIFGKVMGLGQSVSTELFRDEITKNFLADYAAEHFEIASYQALIATAQQIGEHQCIPVLERILEEEIAMARWIEDNIPLAVRIGLERTATRHTNRSVRSNAVQGIARAVTPKTTTLTTVLVGSALGAAAVYFLKSDKNKERMRLYRRENLELAQHRTAAPQDESGTPVVKVSSATAR